jgi:hypothetical protein
LVGELKEWVDFVHGSKTKVFIPALRESCQSARMRSTIN